MKRRLADIDPGQYRQLLAIQRHCRKAGQVVPSIPALIKCCMDIGLPETIKRWTPEKLSQ